MCFGSKKSAPVQQDTPAPQPATTFSYVSPDDSRTRQRQAAVDSTTAMGEFGSQLGGAGGKDPATPATAKMMGG
jgi:hypothetical protein